MGPSGKCKPGKDKAQFKETCTLNSMNKDEDFKLG